MRGRSKKMPKEKAKIETVGYVDSNGQPQGWTFNGEGRNVAGIEVDNGTVYWCGYSVDELKEIAERGQPPTETSDRPER
jgi:hypothetical protein